MGIAQDFETVAFLHAHGMNVEPRRLSAMVRAAVAVLPRDVRPGSVADLTAPEVEALERGGFDLDDRKLADEDPLVLTAAKYAALLRDSLTTASAARELRVKPSRIRQRLTADPPTLYGLRVNSRWVIPRFQFHQRQMIRGFEAILEKLDRELHPVAFYTWFVTPSVDLVAGEQHLSPQQWLIAGYSINAVARLAEDL
jgi:plasmid maintenance system killer protein